MTLLEAKTLALNLMAKHGITDNGWVFGFINTKTTLGRCNYTYKVISLSKDYVLNNSVEQITNTILHEIAHALVGKGHGHNHVWQRKALAIGCDGQRCSKAEIPSKYRAVCGICKAVHKRHRKPSKISSCACTGIFNREHPLIFEDVSKK